MDIIRDNIFLIILLLAGAISQWLKARGEARQNQEPNVDPADIEEMIEEVERRHFGPAVPPPLPPNALPHPSGGMIAPASVMRRNSGAVGSAPATASFDNSDELARQQQIAEKLKEAKRTRGAREMSESILPRKQAAATPVAASGLSLKERLGNHQELRQAFVLKEILEKPLALR